MLLSVPFGERITLGGAQRPRDFAHLLIDIVVPCAGGECIELRFEIRALLPLERRRALFVSEWTMASGARRDRTQGTADRNECRRRLAVALSYRRKRCEIGGHVSDFLVVQRCGHRLHERVL